MFVNEMMDEMINEIKSVVGFLFVGFKGGKR